MGVLNCYNLEKIKCNGRCGKEKKSVLECTKEVPERRNRILGRGKTV